MSNTDYNKNVLDHFRSPRNMGELVDFDVEAMVGNPTCGDVLRIMIKIDPELDSQGHQTGQGVISDIGFLTMGCAAAIATSSALTEMVKGLSLDEALKVSASDVTEYLGGLPGIKKHCSNLGAEALGKALGEFKTGR